MASTPGRTNSSAWTWNRPLPPVGPLTPIAVRTALGRASAGHPSHALDVGRPRLAYETGVLSVLPPEARDELAPRWEGGPGILRA
ncbi:hypothetical protein OHT57_06010 [Streptomyces sp. NBC_00285]|uniref:hypothetical protein n=1 Tax=Streptomyces sp. NBC_00285 TaxID=2975700 RepID=UPI002E2C89CE|nr:hypothetical protein [Streptomyces sp. NBC_00285]